MLRLVLGDKLELAPIGDNPQVRNNHSEEENTLT